MDRAVEPCMDLKPDDVVLVSVLGAVHDSCLPLNEIIAVANNMAPEVWQPTAQVIGNCIVSALNAGQLRLSAPVNCYAGVCYEITDFGRHVLRDRLRKSLPSQCASLARTCVAAKLCFLDCMEAADQTIQVEELAHAYRNRLKALQQREEGCAGSRCHSKLWLDHEIERCGWELAWLERLRSNISRDVIDQ
ncbi:MAG: hypothetical protein H6905_10185 [Hyphomicrobiales bacterium]|nr:hypothetical protein [Hyphomicrobiales bacterium]